MSLDFQMLVWSVALAFIQMLVAVSGCVLQVGLPKLAGNREGLQPMTGWVGRAQRAHLNMLENLVLFAPLVLIADITSRNNAVTELGAEIFFWARLVYAIVYIIGIPWLRTTIWGISAIGLVMIFLQLQFVQLL
jgi:uncharacterized MAPEG superfamily protein